MMEHDEREKIEFEVADEKEFSKIDEILKSSLDSGLSVSQIAESKRIKASELMNKIAKVVNEYVFSN